MSYDIGTYIALNNKPEPKRVHGWFDIGTYIDLRTKAVVRRIPVQFV